MATSATGEMWFDWGSEGVLLVAHTKQAPDAATWSAMCRAAGQVMDAIGEVRILVFTDGGGPTGAQRDELARATRGKRYRTSVVSTASSVRFIVSSIALVNPAIKSFLPADWRRSLEHLGITAGELRKVEQAVQEFAARPHAQRFAVLNALLATGARSPSSVAR